MDSWVVEAPTPTTEVVFFITRVLQESEDTKEEKLWKFGKMRRSSSRKSFLPRQHLKSHLANLAGGGSAGGRPRHTRMAPTVSGGSRMLERERERHRAAGKMCSAQTSVDDPCTQWIFKKCSTPSNHYKWERWWKTHEMSGYSILREIQGLIWHLVSRGSAETSPAIWGVTIEIGTLPLLPL